MLRVVCFLGFVDDDYFLKLVVSLSSMHFRTVTFGGNLSALD